MLILKCKEMNEMKMKEILGVVLLTVFVVGIMIYGADRNAQIENGEMIQISESEMR